MRDDHANHPEVIRDLIRSEIHAQANSLINGVRNHYAHPSYGYTKTSLRQQRDRMDGMVQALLASYGSRAATPDEARTMLDKGYTIAGNSGLADKVHRARDAVSGL